MIIDSVRDFFRACPLLKNNKVNVDYLGEKPVRYTIDNIPSNPIIKNYTDGGSLRQFIFTFGSREYYDMDVLNNIDTAKFYEQLAEWIEQQCNSGNLPVLGGKTEAQDIKILTSGYLYDSANMTTARWQLQLKLIYKKEI